MACLKYILTISTLFTNGQVETAINKGGKTSKDIVATNSNQPKARFQQLVSKYTSSKYAIRTEISIKSPSLYHQIKINKLFNILKSKSISQESFMDDPKCDLCIMAENRVVTRRKAGNKGCSHDTEAAVLCASDLRLAPDFFSNNVRNCRPPSTSSPSCNFTTLIQNIFYRLSKTIENCQKVFLFSNVALFTLHIWRATIPYIV